MSPHHPWTYCTRPSYPLSGRSGTGQHPCPRRSRNRPNCLHWHNRQYPDLQLLPRYLPLPPYQCPLSQRPALQQLFLFPPLRQAVRQLLPFLPLRQAAQQLLPFLRSPQPVQLRFPCPLLRPPARQQLQPPQLLRPVQQPPPRRHLLPELTDRTQQLRAQGIKPYTEQRFFLNFSSFFSPRFFRFFIYACHRFPALHLLSADRIYKSYYTMSCAGNGQ